MEWREKELSDIKKISSQILSQTDAMKTDVLNQKDALGKGMF